MAGDPMEAIMAAMQGGANVQRQRFGMPEAEAAALTDEDMLAQVQRGMGNEEGPPPGSGMKWEDLAEDQAALQEDPSPINVQAFVQYWGEENLPEEVQVAAGAPSEAGEY